MEKFVFDVISQTLTITAKFAKMMNDPQSDEYKLVQQFRKDFPNLTICGTHDGYFKDDEPVVQAIHDAAPDLLFVCLGAPRQEKFMAKYADRLGAKLAMGLGGSLDVYAGVVERAPEAWQKMNLEWAYRLVKEPKRIGRMAKLPLVLVKAAGVRMTGKKGGEG